MRTLLATALSLVISLPVLGQTTANTGAPQLKDPKEVLAAAAPFYDFASPGVKPWHLKAVYQFYDSKGNPTEQGTWEYWRASAKAHRSSWTRTGVEHTVWSTADGTVYRKDSGMPLRHFEKAIEGTFFSLLPAREIVDSDRLKLELKMLPPQKPELACVLATSQWLVAGKLKSSSSGRPDYYCFDPATLALRMTESNYLTTQFHQLVRTQGRYLARQVVVTEGKQTLFTISVETIDAIQTDDAMLKPPIDAAPEQQTSGPLVGTKAEVTAGSIVKKIPPVYPIASKAAHEQGVVILGATIGTDGRIHDLEVLAAPSPLLADSALEAVKKWEYQPYQLNGKPVEVETVVNVTYSLGR